MTHRSCAFFSFLDTFSTGRRDRLDQDLIRRMAHQIFTAISHMHSRGIIHRDIKPENILVDATGEHIKVADLGSCRSMTNSNQPMTEYIATRWYRSPECLLTDGYYGPEMDIWGAGCVVFEITALFPLFPGADEIDQINRIHKVIGTPPSSVLSKLKAKGSSRINYNFPPQRGVGIKHFISHAPQEEVDLLKQTLIYDYNDRIKAHEVLKSPYFKSLHNKKSRVALGHSPTHVQSTTNINPTSNSGKISSRHTKSSNIGMSMQNDKKVVSPSSTDDKIPLADPTENDNSEERNSSLVSSPRISRAHPSRRVSLTNENQTEGTNVYSNNSFRSPSSRFSKNVTTKAATMSRRVSTSPTSPTARVPSTSDSPTVTLPRRRASPSVSSSPQASKVVTTKAAITSRRRVSNSPTSSKARLSNIPDSSAATSPRRRTHTHNTKPAGNVSSTSATARIQSKTNAISTASAFTRRRVATNTNAFKTATTTSTTRRRVIPTTLSKSKSSDDAYQKPMDRRQAASSLFKSKSHDVEDTISTIRRRNIAPRHHSNSIPLHGTTSQTALTNRRQIVPSTKSDHLHTTSTLTRRRNMSNTLSNHKPSDEVLKSSKPKLSTQTTLANRRTAVTNQNRIQPNHSSRRTPDSTSSSLPSLVGLPTRRRNKYSHIQSSGYGRTYAPKNVSAGTINTLASSKSNSPSVNFPSSQMSRSRKLPKISV